MTTVQIPRTAESIAGTPVTAAMGAGESMVVDPRTVVIRGLDDANTADPLCDPDSNGQKLDACDITAVAMAGIHENIILTRCGRDLVVVAGRKRVRWARAALDLPGPAGKAAFEKCAAVRALVMKDASTPALLTAMFVENAQRRETTMLWRAERTAIMHDAGMSNAEIASRCAATEQAVRDWLHLGRAIPAVRDSVRAGKISATAGVLIGRKGTLREQQAALQRTLCPQAATPTTTGERPRTVPARQSDDGRGATGPLAKQHDKAELRPAKPQTTAPRAGSANAARAALGYTRREKGARQAADTSKGPRRWLIGRILDCSAAGECDLEASTVHVLRWVYGTGEPRLVKGLSAAIRMVEAKGEG